MITATNVEPDSQHRTVHFVPNEICVVCSSNGAVDDDRRDRVYETVRTFLNVALAGETWTRPNNLEETSLRRSLVLSQATHPDVWDRIQGGNLLQPLTRRIGRAAHVFDRRDGSTTHLHFYQLNDVPSDAGLTAEDLDRHIQQLVLFINAEFAARPSGRNVDGGWQIIGATPHWLAAASDSEGGSPAAPPVAEALLDKNKRPQNWQFRFDGTPNAPNMPDPAYPLRARLQSMVDEQRAATTKGVISNVIVAVLDTCPERDTVKGEAMKCEENMLLQQVVGLKAPRGVPFASNVTPPSNPVHLDERHSLSPNDFAQMAQILPDWQQHSSAWTAASKGDYKMPDHGLFVAGIVKDIAPTAEIHLIRAKDDYGMTDWLTLTEILSVLPNILRRGQVDHLRVVVNLSLTVSVPTHEEMLREWQIADAIANTGSDTGYHVHDICGIHAAIHSSLREVIAWLGEKGVLVVAAAGNYNDRDDRSRPQPRFPAQYEAELDNVLSVAAMTLTNQPASYSNLAERSVSHARGIATIGGNTVPQPADGNKPVIATTQIGTPLTVDAGVAPIGQADAIRGIFSADALPITTSPNLSGWVDWSGTSFSTPVISAIAAIIWDRNPDLSPVEVISAVQGFADIARPELNCNGIYAYQQAL